MRGQSESQIGEEEKKNGRLVAAAETSKKHAEWRRFQQKNLNILGLLKRKEWPQCHRESNWQVGPTRPCQKEKERIHLFRSPDREGGESQGKREPHLGERGGSEREHVEKRVDSIVKEGGFQKGERGQARRASLREVKGSMSG